MYSSTGNFHFFLEREEVKKKQAKNVLRLRHSPVKSSLLQSMKIQNSDWEFCIGPTVLYVKLAQW